MSYGRMTVSKRLGHTSVSVTLNTYGHVVRGADAEAADTFAASMSTPMSTNSVDVLLAGVGV